MRSICLILTFLVSQVSEGSSQSWCQLYKKNCETHLIDTSEYRLERRTYMLEKSGERLLRVDFLDSNGLERASIYLGNIANQSIRYFPKPELRIDPKDIERLIGKKDEAIERRFLKKYGDGLKKVSGSYLFEFSNISEEVSSLILENDQVVSKQTSKRPNDSTLVRFNYSRNYIVDRFLINKQYRIDTTITSFQDSSAYNSFTIIDSFDFKNGVVVNRDHSHSTSRLYPNKARPHAKKLEPKVNAAFTSRAALWRHAKGLPENKLLLIYRDSMVRLSRPVSFLGFQVSEIRKRELNDSMQVFTYSSSDSFHTSRFVEKRLFNPSRDTSFYEHYWQRVCQIDTCLVKNGEFVLLSSDLIKIHCNIENPRKVYPELRYKRREHGLKNKTQLIFDATEAKHGHIFHQARYKGRLVDQSAYFSLDKRLFRLQCEMLRDKWAANSRPVPNRDSIPCNKRLGLRQAHIQGQCFVCFGEAVDTVGDTIYTYALSKKTPLYYMGQKVREYQEATMILSEEQMLAFFRGEFEKLGISVQVQRSLKPKKVIEGSKTTYYYDKNESGYYTEKIVEIWRE